MKKILVAGVILIIIIVLYPKRIVNGSGMPYPGQVIHYQKCYGTTINISDLRSTDGPRIDLCFGIIKNGTIQYP